PRPGRLGLLGAAPAARGRRAGGWREARGRAGAAAARRPGAAAGGHAALPPRAGAGMRLPAALLLAALGAAAAQEVPAPPGAPTAPAQAPAPSPRYAERRTKTREPGPLDPVPDTAFRLALLLRDGGVPGFYDGQFASVADRLDDLARLANDPDMNHVLRVMAIMALQEAGSGAQVVAALDPLIIPAHEEVDINRDAWDAAG